jgi:hypothetical protein
MPSEVPFIGFLRVADALPGLLAQALCCGDIGVTACREVLEFSS